MLGLLILRGVKMDLRVLALAVAGLVLGGGCDVEEIAKDVGAEAGCQIVCAEALTCGFGDCSSRCVALSDDAALYAACTGCIEAAGTQCELVENCKALCHPSALDEPECPLFCAGLNASCDVLDVDTCLATCPNMTDGARSQCTDCYEQSGKTCEAIATCQECAGTGAPTSTP
jgi:hypothetical protein